MLDQPNHAILCCYCMRHEEDRVPVVRPLDAVAAVADAVGVGRAAPVHRPGRRRRGARGRRRVLPGAPLRPPAGLAVPAARRDRRRRTSRIEIGTGVIDMRYENPLYMAEDAGAADLISGGRLSSASAGAHPSR